MTENNKNIDKNTDENIINSNMNKSNINESKMNESKHNKSNNNTYNDSINGYNDNNHVNNYNHINNDCLFSSTKLTNTDILHMGLLNNLSNNKIFKLKFPRMLRIGTFKKLILKRYALLEKQMVH